MSLIRITDAVVEPVTLAEAKRHLRIDCSDSDLDSDITDLIATARMAAEDRLQRTLIATQWRYTADQLYRCHGLPMGHVMSVQKVEIRDASGQLQPLEPTDWRLVEDSIMPTFGHRWPDHLAEPGAVCVAYTAGYGDTAAAVPRPIVQWIKLALTDLYTQRSRVAERPAVPQEFADSLLDTYRVLTR